MRNSDLCIIFVNGTRDNVKGNSMSINFDGSKLYSYGTCIAQKLPNGSIIVNATKYSATTSKHQSYLRRAIPSERKTHVTTKHVPFGAYDLTRYI